jgi:hypothetical protein
MKCLFCLLMLSSVAFAECDIKPLKKEIISNYQTHLPVTNEKGEIGHATAKNFVIADYLMRVKTENFLIANFDLDIKWLKGKKQTIKTLVVATVNLSTCTIDSFEPGDTLGNR